MNEEQPPNFLRQGARRVPPRAPLPKAKLPGQAPIPAPQQRAPAPAPQQRAPLPRAPNPVARPKSPQPQPQPAPGGKRPSSPVHGAEGKAPSAPKQPTRRTSSPVTKAEAEPAPKTRKEPASVEELIPVLVKHAAKREEGLTTAIFDEKFLPRLKAFVPDSLARMEREVINEYFVDIAHALYVAVVIGQFSNRPVLSGVRSAELGADLIERVIQNNQGREDKRITQIRCANLLVGLTLGAVRLLESTSLGSQSIQGFTDRYERAVITTYGLKTQAEATGAAPWVGDKGSPLDKRIGRAINTMSGVFGDYIGANGETMDDRQYDEVLSEFDGFMERFAPYITGGRGGAEERRKKLSRGTAAMTRGVAKVEPLDIKEVRTRPAGVEIVLSDGRILFASARDAKRIGAAAEGEIDDTGKRERQAIEQRRRETGEIDADEDDEAIAEIEQQMKDAKTGKRGA